MPRRKERRTESRAEKYRTENPGGRELMKMQAKEGGGVPRPRRKETIGMKWIEIGEVNGGEKVPVKNVPVLDLVRARLGVGGQEAEVVKECAGAALRVPYTKLDARRPAHDPHLRTRARHDLGLERSPILSSRVRWGAGRTRSGRSAGCGAGRDAGLGAGGASARRRRTPGAASVAAAADTGSGIGAGALGAERAVPLRRRHCDAGGAARSAPRRTCPSRSRSRAAAPVAVRSRLRLHSRPSAVGFVDSGCSLGEGGRPGGEGDMSRMLVGLPAAVVPTSMWDWEREKSEDRRRRRALQMQRQV
ncbi:hypothetical protein C8J57DRAFT_1245869 [Mycena rebaudengoi]|nr:hypothetical protein C8J57DRAFT_1245869 [Mycena rebaudengoi]